MARTKRADQQLEDAFNKAQIPDPDGTITIVEGDQHQSVANPEPEAIVIEEHSSEDDALQVLQRNFDELKAQAEKDRKEAETARAQAAEAARSADTYRRQVEESSVEVRKVSIAAIDSGIAHTKNNIATLKAEIQRCASMGEWDRFADAQEALSQNTMHLQQLLQNRSQTESGTGRAPVLPASADDDAEKFISQLTAPSQAWVRSHKDDVFSSASRYNKMIAAHNMAVADGYQPDTDAYFGEIDKYMGYTQKQSALTFTPRADAQSNQSQQRASSTVPSAPPARINPGQPLRNDQMRLSKEQMETAVQIYSDKSREDAIALYAKGLKEIRDGKTNLRLSNDKYRGGYNGI